MRTIAIPAKIYSLLGLLTPSMKPVATKPSRKLFVRSLKSNGRAFVDVSKDKQHEELHLEFLQATGKHGLWTIEICNRQNDLIRLIKVQTTQGAYTLNLQHLRQGIYSMTVTDHTGCEQTFEVLKVD